MFQIIKKTVVVCARGAKVFRCVFRGVSFSASTFRGCILVVAIKFSLLIRAAGSWLVWCAPRTSIGVVSVWRGPGAEAPDSSVATPTPAGPTRVRLGSARLRSTYTHTPYTSYDVLQRGARAHRHPPKFKPTQPKFLLF